MPYVHECPVCHQEFEERGYTMHRRSCQPMSLEQAIRVVRETCYRPSRYPHSPKTTRALDQVIEAAKESLTEKV